MAFKVKAILIGENCAIQQVASAFGDKMYYVSPKLCVSGIFHSFLSALWQFFFGSFNVLIHSGCLVEFVRFTIVSDPLILHGIDDWILLIISRLPLQLSSLDLVITLVHLIGSTTSYFGGCAVIAYTLGSKIFHVIRA